MSGSNLRRWLAISCFVDERVELAEVVGNLLFRSINRELMAHLQSSVSHYPKILHNLNMKNGRSDTPLS